MPAAVRLPAGGELRRTGPPGAEAIVVCVNGGQSGEVPGTWSASLEWLVARLAPRFPELAFGEVKYRIKSWHRLDWCVEDARDATAALGGRRQLLLGFSMGAGVAVQAADDPRVQSVLGLAPWIPDPVDISTLRGRRYDVLHGTLDRPLPGIPGVSPASSRRSFERARSLGVEGSYTLIPGALHGVALRSQWGGLVPLPRARTWARLVELELARFQAGG